jgi:hypothetical protein
VTSNCRPRTRLHGTSSHESSSISPVTQFRVTGEPNVSSRPNEDGTTRR